MQKILCAAVAITALTLGACTTVVRTPGPTRVVYRDAPPPPMESIPAPPLAGTYWVPGH
jgi:hypothetical protein